MKREYNNTIYKQIIQKIKQTITSRKDMLTNNKANNDKQNTQRT